MATLQTFLEANTDRQAGRQKKPLIGAWGLEVPLCPKNQLQPNVTGVRFYFIQFFCLFKIISKVQRNALNLNNPIIFLLNIFNHRQQFLLQGQFFPTHSEFSNPQWRFFEIRAISRCKIMSRQHRSQGCVCCQAWTKHILIRAIWCFVARGERGV